MFRAEPDESLVELVSPLPPGRAVDLGAGEGRNSLWLAREGWDVVAVDASEVALDRLSRAAAVEGVEVLGLEQRRGKSDVSEPGTDVVLWALRRATERESPSPAITQAS